MKLHLPIALLTAVISAMAYAAEPVYTLDANGNATVTVDSNVTGQALNSGSSKLGWVTPLQTAGSAASSIINIENGGVANKVTASGTMGRYVTGDKTVNVYEGGNVGAVYAGYIDVSSSNGNYGSAAAPSASSALTNLGPKAQPDEEGNYPSININVYEGAVVAGIYGSTWMDSGRLPLHMQALVASGMTKAEAESDIVNNYNPGALNEAVNINVYGGNVTGIYGGITGGSVDNKVIVTIDGANATVGYVYGGTMSNVGSAGGVNYNIQGYVDSTHIKLENGTVGTIYGGGVYNQLSSVVKEGTLIELTGGTVTGNVYGAGENDKVYGGTHVVVNGDATILGDIYGAGTTGKEVQSGDRVITFDNHGEVDWTKVHDFDAVEFTGTTTTKLGTDGQLAENYKKVTINNSYITGSIRDGHEVELDVTNNIHVALDGNLTTTAGSEIVNNENAIQIGGNATFKGTEIENSTIVAGGNIAVNSGSVVTNGNLVAADGDVSFSKSTMNGGEITVGGKLSVVQSDVTVDKINGADKLQLNLQGGVNGADSSLTIHDDVTLDANSRLFGIETKDYGGGAIIEGCRVTLTANSVTLDEHIDVNGDDIYAATVNATKGDITIGAHNSVGASDLVAQGSVILKDGARLVDGEADISTATALTGDVVLSDVFEVRNSDLTAENGSVILESSTMNGGNIVAGEKLELFGSTATVDSINGGNAVKLDMTSAYVDGKLVGSNLNVNGDVVLANGSKIWGAESTEYPFFGKLEGCTSSLTADSITTGEGASDTLPVGAGDFMYAKLEATKGDISIGANNVIKDTDLTAANDVKLESSKMEGGKINAGGELVLNNSEVSVKSIGKDGAVVDSTNSQLEVTEVALVLNGGSVVKDSELISKEGVELRGTTMTGSTVETDGTFSVIKGSNVTMGSVEGLKTIEISDSSFTTGKVELSNGESITSQNSNFTATDIVVNGGNFAADGTIKANSITVSDQGLIQIGDAKGTTKTQMELNATGSQSGLVSGKLEITNTDLTVSGGSSQFWIDGGTMTVDKGSKVDLSAGTTLRVGSENAGELIVQGGSTLIGGANNLWVYDNSTIKVSGEGSVMGVCNDKDHYNYRVLMGITNHDGAQGSATQAIVVEKGGEFTSSATQFVTNFHSNTNTSIVADGGKFVQTGTNMNGSHYEVGTTGEWVQDKDGNWLDAGSAGVGGKYVTGNTDTITYLLSNGTDKNGVLGYAVENAAVEIQAINGGSVQFDSALTYVGNVGVTAEYINANASNVASFIVGENSEMSFKQMEVYANAGVSNKGTFTASKINVHNGALFDYNGSGKMTAGSLGVDKGGVMNLGSAIGEKSNVTLNVAGSGQSGIISGALNVTNTDLVVTGSSSSQFWIDGGVMTVDGKSNVDLSAGTTLRVGNENAGVLNVQGGSTLIGGANNLWVYDNSTIKVSGEGSVMGVCNDKDHYNYRVLMGITNHDGADGSEATQSLNVTDGGTFTSSATQFVTNFHSGTKTFITADGGTFVQTGTNMNGNHYEVGTTGEWKQDKDGNWLDAGSAGVGGKYVTGNTDTITYLLSNGTDKNGVLGYPVSNAQVAIGAINGGTVKFDSALTYVGNVGVSDEYIKANEKNYAHFGVDETSNMSFKQMEVYANAAIQSHYTEGKTTGTFTATGMNIHNGANVSLSAIKEGAMGSALVTGHLTVNGKLDVIGSHLNVVGSSSQVAIGYGDSGIMNVKDSVVDISNAQTLHIGYDPLTKEQQKNTQLNIVNSTFKGGSQNAWLGGGTINVQNSAMEVCTGNGTSNNYRVLMGLSGNTVNLNVTDGSTFKSEASRFVTNYQDGSTVNIVVDNSTFTQAAQARVGKDKEGNPIMEDSITYLADRGVDNHGKPIVNETYPQGLVNNVETNITAKNGGVVNFESKNTYIGNALDREYGYTNKQVNLSVGEGSSMSFNHMEIFADTKIDNQGTFNVESVNVNDGATLETLGSLDLNEVALAGGTLFNQGSLSMDSLELEHASLLFAATSLTDASAAINYTGTHLTNFGPNGSSVSIDDMVDNFGIVLTGAGAQELIDAGETGVTFSFTLADYVGNGESDFESQLALVLNTKENLADFSITVGSAILREGDGELKNLKVEATENGVVISGIAVIPEPTTATLSLLALAALAARRRRK